MISSTLFAFVLFFVAGIQAHMSISFPPPFRGPTNALATNKNFDINTPISAAQFPCSGEHKTGGPSAATLTAGAESKITFSGSAIHSGGSCQVGLSYDKQTFFVIHSWMGNCPIAGGSLPFTVPSDAPTGEAVFAWTWVNKVGNREFYMNCGAVTIVGGAKRQTPKVAFKDRPDLFVANLNNGCTTPEGADVIFPNPGPDVTGSGTGAPVTGCQPVNGIGNSQRGSGSAPVAAPQPSASQPAPSSTTRFSFSGTPVISVPTATPTVGRPVARPSNSSSPQPTDSLVIIPIASSTTIIATGTAPATPTATGATPPSAGNLTESQDGTCSGAKSQKCRAGFCCSAANFCGSSSLHCGSGCQAGFGQCGATAVRRSSLYKFHGHQLHSRSIAGRIRF